MNIHWEIELQRQRHLLSEALDLCILALFALGGLLLGWQATRELWRQQNMRAKVQSDLSDTHDLLSVLAYQLQHWSELLDADTSREPSRLVGRIGACWLLHWMEPDRCQDAGASRSKLQYCHGIHGILAHCHDMPHIALMCSLDHNLTIDIEISIRQMCMAINQRQRLDRSLLCHADARVMTPSVSRV